MSSGLSRVPTPRSAVQHILPVAASVLALGYLVGAFALPFLTLPVTVAAAVGVCFLVLAQRDHPGLRRTIWALLGWLATALGGALVLASRPLAAMAWIIVVVFLIPLPVIPWLYARTFRDGDG